MAPIIVSLIITGIVFVFLAIIDRDELKKNLAEDIVLSVIVFLLSAIICPMAAIALFASILITALLTKIKLLNDRAILFLIISAVILLFITCVVVPGLYSVPYTDTREIVKDQQLVAVKEIDRTSGEYYFLSGSATQRDYYDYRYRDGVGFRNDMISKYGPYIEENSTFKDSGRMLFLQRYKIYQAQNTWDRVWEFLYNPNGKVAEGKEEIEIYVPFGTVDNIMKM
ncbi:MAG: hypothetical protein WC446_03595 [Candidatus Paceibacterota bacterium]|jgi:hypothetical protein